MLTALSSLGLRASELNALFAATANSGRASPLRSSPGRTVLFPELAIAIGDPRDGIAATTPLLPMIDPDEISAALDRIRGLPLGLVSTTGGAGWRRAWWSPTAFLSRSHSKLGFSHPLDRFLNFERLFRRNGAILTPLVGERGVGVRIVGGVLELMIVDEAALFMTCGGFVKVELPVEIPHTVAIAARGRMLGELVAHPAFEGRPYRIRSVELRGGSTLITARTGVDPFDHLGSRPASARRTR